MSIKVLKNEIIYNLDHYAKVYPNRDKSILCLADVQGDYDSLCFDSNRELNIVFKLIKSAFKEKQTEDITIDLDELHQTLSKEVTIDQDELKKMFDKYYNPEFENRRYDPPEHAEEENEWPAEHQQPWPDPWSSLDEEGERDTLPEEHEEAQDADEEIEMEELADPDEFTDEDEEVNTDMSDDSSEQVGPFNNPNLGLRLEDMISPITLDAATLPNRVTINGVDLEDRIREEITNQLASQLDGEIENRLTSTPAFQDLYSRQFAEAEEDRCRLEELTRRNQRLEEQLQDLRNMVFDRILADQNN